MRKTLGIILLISIVAADVIQCPKCHYGGKAPAKKQKRSIDLNSAHTLIAETRLPREVTPKSYRLELQPFIDEGKFKGRIKIIVAWQEPSSKITLHVHQDLQVAHSEVIVTQLGDELINATASPTTGSVNVVRTERHSKRPWYIIHLAKPLNRGTQCEVDLTFSGRLQNDTSEAFFRSSYTDAETNQKRWFAATYMRPNLARRVFPCFDEPSYKVPFTISVARTKNMTVLSNMPLIKTEQAVGEPGWLWDHFQETPPMSTFSVGIVVFDFQNLTSNLTNEEKDDPDFVQVAVWGRPDYMEALENATRKVEYLLKRLKEFWEVPYPLPKLDCVALPNYQALKPADNWGLILFKESELGGRGVWQVAVELVYQWLGNFATPFWWSDAHINKALASYIATTIVFDIDNGKEMEGKWPMTELYSLYYEYSKRYPYSRITGMKQETASVKTQLIFRMLNYTLTNRTFRHGLQRFMSDRQFKTFTGDDIWNAIDHQAHFDRTLADEITVNEIANSWNTKDRLPVISVIRNYNTNSAKIQQRVYLRERPHDVPDQDKLLWWVPIVLVTQDKMNFLNATPTVWMKKEREIELTNLPGPESFIIVNPEEIGPFPVNYDVENWNKLAQYLLKSESRNKIPVNTRAKLLHDAWNLAYAGDLSFGTALNMTLFLKYERNHLAWDPVFTMIDHIGRHIDSSEVYKKFETYIRILLTPLYEELGSEEKEGEDPGITHLRRLSKVLLCKAGYRPCIEEAQQAYNKWMQSENPDEGNPVANKYICPVFKWGTQEEWEFGLQRIINFPPQRKPSERTYLLKTLAGCPNDCWKVERLLNITILEENGNFTDNDIYLIFSMLTGSANGYISLFNFLSENWDTIKMRFESKPDLWESLITSATTVFTTQEGLNMVSELYVKHQGEFGPAEHIIERALKNIKEETKWSDDNLPVIENWVDNYLRENKVEALGEDKFL